MCKRYSQPELRGAQCCQQGERSCLEPGQTLQCAAELSTGPDSRQRTPGPSLLHSHTAFPASSQELRERQLLLSEATLAVTPGAADICLASCCTPQARCTQVLSGMLGVCSPLRPQCSSCTSLSWGLNVYAILPKGSGRCCPSACLMITRPFRPQFKCELLGETAR